jgi:UDP-glucose 4-epimerase
MLADFLQQELGKTPDVKPGPRRAGDLERSVLDPTMFHDKLGATTSLAEGLKQTARWFAQQ